MVCFPLAPLLLRSMVLLVSLPFGHAEGKLLLWKVQSVQGKELWLSHIIVVIVHHAWREK